MKTRAKCGWKTSCMLKAKLSSLRLIFFFVTLMFFSTLNITKNICDDDDDGAVDVDDYGVAFCVCVSARRVEADLCVNVEISHSPLFSLLLVSLSAFLFLLYFRLCLSFAHAALARSSVSWAAGTVEVSNFDLAHSKPVQKNLMEEKLFHIF